MRLGRKLGVWFLLVTLGISAVSAVWIVRGRTMRSRFELFANRTTPSIVALGQIKAAFFEMLAKTHHVTGVTVPPDAPTPEREAAVAERQRAAERFDDAKVRFDEWMAILKGVADSEADRALGLAVSQAGTALYDRGVELLDLKGQGASEAVIAVKRAELGDAEARFVRIIDKAMAVEIVRMKREREAVQQNVQATTWLSGIAIGAAGALAVAFGLFVGWTIVRPVTRLAQDVNTVGTGDLTRRTPVKSNDEIGLLASSFNRMTEHLERTTVSKRYVDNIITSMADLLIVIRPDGTIKTVNRAAVELLGYRDGELVGQPLQLVFAGAGGRMPSAVGFGIGEVFDGGTVLNAERVLLAKDGRMIPVLFSATPMVDDEGARQGVVCVALDITDRKRAEEALRNAYAELQEAQQQLVQSEKLAALGRFAAGVAHEVKNPLAIILGGVDLLRSEVANPTDDAKTSFELIERSVHRADTIVRDLLKFARPSTLQKERVKPEELVNGTLALLAYSGALKEIEAATQFAHGRLELDVDKNQIQQVLLNLFMNAVDAMRAGGRLVVSTAAEASDGRQHCVIEVADTGEGIAPENLRKLFEPFFTTKRDRKGTGLGLSISKTIVESHAGRVAVRSELGKGTVFTVVLPAAMGGTNA